MTGIPEIPAEALAAVRDAAWYIDVSHEDELEHWREALARAWPHLFAAAVEIAASDLDRYVMDRWNHNKEPHVGDLTWTLRQTAAAVRDAAPDRAGR